MDCYRLQCIEKWFNKTWILFQLKPYFISLLVSDTNNMHVVSLHRKKIVYKENFNHL